MVAEAPRSNASPDSYIGSLISLISKSEIRYEGILYKINTEESSIGLRNVRSFGTEGRKMDGQHVPASDKIYEFILFRGSDIKDLQVKASPPAQTTPMQNDPAIIQSNYLHPSTASPSLPANMLSFGSISAPELDSYTAQFLPTYQTGGSFGTWSATPPPPSRNVSGLAAPMHWQGYHAHSQGLSHLQEPPLIRPPPGLATSPMQQTLQYQGTNALLYSGSSNYPEFPRLFPPVSSNLNLASTSLPSTVSPIEVTSSLTSEMSPFLVSNKFPKTSLSAQIPSVMLPPLSSLAPSIETSASLTFEISPFSVSNNVPKTSLPAQLPSVMLSPLSSLASSVETSSSLPQNIPSVSSMPGTGPFSSVANQTEIRSTLPVVGSSPPIVGSSGSKQLEASVTLVAPDQLMQPTTSVHPSAESLIKVCNEVEIKPLEDRTKALLSERPATKSEAKTKLKSAPKEPILPLPSPAYRKPNGALLHATQTRGGYGSGSGSGSGRGRGRGRGSGYTRPVAKFSEEFDFTAMNEKFNKGKVWGDLGRGEAHSSDREQEEETDQFDDDNPESLKFRIKPVYVKDEFFDTLSRNSNDQASNGRIKYSEQLKIDTETFGNFQLNNLTYGGRGLGGGGGGGGDGGRGRSSYSDRSYGYSARGRGYKGNNGAS